MRIAAYGMSFPDNSAMSKRLAFYCKALAFRGVDLKVYSLDNIANNGVYEGIRFEHIQAKRLLHRHYYRFFNEPLLILNFMKIATQYDVILIGRLGWFTTFVLSVLAKLAKTKLVMELNENPRALIGGPFTPKLIKIINGWLLFNISFPRLDGFICISKSLEELVENYRRRDAIKILIPILCDFPEIKYPKDSLQFPYIFHAGSLSETKDGVIAMFEAFALASKRTSLPLKFILTTRIATRDLLSKIDKIISENGLMERVVFMGILDNEKLNVIRNNATLAIVNKPNNLQNKYNFPTKLGELLSAGVPVIASETGEMSQYLTDNQTAYLVEANNSIQIADKIIDILENQEKAKTISKKGKELALESFYYKNYSEHLYNFFSSIN